MTDKEMRELDAWLAEHVFGWVWVRDYKWDDFDRLKPYKQLVDPRRFDLELCEVADGSELPEFHGVPRYTSPYADLLRSVKREIKRRGWSWQVASDIGDGYYFVVFGPPTSGSFAKRLAEVFAETEELAGCLALKEAVECTTS